MVLKRIIIHPHASNVAVHDLDNGAIQFEAQPKWADSMKNPANKLAIIANKFKTFVESIKANTIPQRTELVFSFYGDEAQKDFMTGNFVYNSGIRNCGLIEFI